MPKQKTKKLITKRIKVTRNGKILRGRAFGRHLKASKSKKHLRRLKKQTTFTKSFEKKLKKVLTKKSVRK